MQKKFRWLVPLLLVIVLVASACGDDDDTTASGGDNGSTATTKASGGSSGGDCYGKTGCIPADQPDVNKDGKVKIAILSPGDTNDNGYYESFVIAAREYADKNDWDLVITDKINPSDAAEQARNACRQKPDMVAIAASELKDAIPVAGEDVCKGTVWYVAGGQGVEQTPYFFQTNDKVEEGQFATGVASGEVLKSMGATKAGFITGPELDFSTTAYKAWAAGVKSVLPNAETVATYTGDFDDSGLGREAANAQLSQGVKLLYPYLGGATDAVADLGKSKGVLSVTPGTDRCSEDKFAISSIFSPGDYFAAALKDFEAGKVKLGVTRTFRIGVDPVPTVKVCPTVKDAATAQAAVDKTIKDIAAGTIDPAAKTKEFKG
jgi:basic membrane protein A